MYIITFLSRKNQHMWISKRRKKAYFSGFRGTKVNSFPQKNGLFQLHHGNITAFLPI